jgi:two-component system, response regulator
MSPQHSVLLVEDSPEDFEATVRALRKAGLANPLHRCQDGDEALDFLFQRGQYADRAKAPRPSMILLDLNLPGTDGRDVLQQIKTNESLCSIPVVVLTTSTDDRDIERCYRMGANSYIKKPVNLDGFMQAIQRLKDFWFEVVVLPKEDEPA